jgi:hypothetical protein
LFLSEDAPPILAESWKGDRSSRGPVTIAYDCDDYTFKVNVLVGELEIGGPPPPPPPVYDDDDGGLDVSISGSDYDGGAPPAVTTSA